MFIAAIQHHLVKFGAVLLIVASGPHLRAGEPDEQPSTATSFVFKIVGKKTLILTEQGSGRVVAGPDSPPISHELTQDYMRYLALDYTTYCEKIGRIAQGSAFFIKSDNTAANGDYTAKIARAPADTVVTLSPEEQARFQAWVKQWQPTPCVKDASLPIDTVRLEPGAEDKIRPGYFFPTRPAKRPDYVPTEYVPAKVLRNDGKFLGWQYFAPAQLKYMHEQ